MISFVEMSFRSISIHLIAFCLGLFPLDSFGELIMIRQRPLQRGDPYVLTCMSDDDRAALVWNDDLRDPSNPTQSPPNQPRTTLDCAIAGSSFCLAGWENMGHWRVANSLEYPMEPVFDSRWEDFPEYSFSPDHRTDEYQYVRHVSQSGTVVFSARGLGNINLRLCEAKIRSDISCFCITIAAWPNLMSKIRSCPHKETEVWNLSEESCNGEEACIQHSQSVLDVSEWRTFTFTWDKDLMEIKAYGGGGFFLRKQFNLWIEVNQLFVQSPNPGRVRFHFYDYLLTRKKNTNLSSQQFYHTTRNFCIELLVSLCATCELKFNVVDYYGNTLTMNKISSAEKLAYGKLSTWQVMKVNTILPEFNYGYIALEIRTILNQYGDQGRWAIDSLRECRSGDFRRESTRSFDPRWYSSSPSLPIVKCQQLSHIPNSLISSDLPLTNNISSNLNRCYPGRTGPTCTKKCNKSCKGTSMCDQSGCICSQGYRNTDCDTECSDGRHGNNCRGRCGSCRSGGCNKVTGDCISGCDDHYVPPDCKRKLKAPVVSDITAASALLLYTEFVPQMKQHFAFQIKTQWTKWISITPQTVKSKSTLIYRETISRLSPSTLYKVQAVLTSVRGTQVKGPEINFTTRCQEPSKPRNLTVMHQGNGVVVLTWNQPLDSYGTITTSQVDIELVNTSLRNNRSTELSISNTYKIRSTGQTQSVKFSLPTSTVYRFSVEVQTAYPCFKRVSVGYRVPASLAFNTEELKVTQTATFIKVNLPTVANDTTDSVLSIIVKGSPTCMNFPVPKQIRKLVNMTDSEEGWIAATFAATKSRPEYLTIGKDPVDDSSKDCPLHPEATYVIIIIVVDSIDNVAAVIASSPIHLIAAKVTDEDHDKPNLSWLAIPIILPMCFMLLFIWRRKLLNSVRQVRGRNIVLYLRNLANFLEATVTCTFQQSPPLPVSDDAEPFETVGTRQTVEWNRYSHSVNIKDFERYVKDSISNGRLRSQFATFPRGLIRPCKYGSRPENKSKNRYANIIPYDSSRVILKKLPDDPFSDYINANYVQGVGKKKAYIAAQGPRPQTIVDFWRMIWQEEVLIICMLANVIERQKVKCEQYWPEFGASKKYGNITIVTESCQVFADYTFRTFRVSCKQEMRKIKHLHYTGWPDHMVPLYPHSVIAYLKKLLTMPIGKGPIVVHCSAGVGRTGTIILCDICLRRAVTKGAVDALAEFKKLRDCRSNMVDNELQYIFAHVVLVECLISLPTELPCNNQLPQAIEKLKKRLPEQMERLRNTAWQDQALHSQVTPKTPLPEHLAKNRFPELTPVTVDLVYLTQYPSNDSSSTYISAVIVDGLRVTKQYLASQLPLPSTLSDFWRLIAEQRIELVIVLQRPDLEDPTCCDIIPSEEPLSPVSFLSVESITSSDPQISPRTDKLLLTDMSDGKERTQRVTVLTCSEWGLGKGGKPPPPKKLVELWISSENIHRKEGPTLVLCHDGSTGCGLYLALCFLLERMAVERECDVIFAVRSVRRSRPDFVQTQEQFEYLYDAAATYVESFGTYANFA